MKVSCYCGVGQTTQNPAPIILCLPAVHSPSEPFPAATLLLFQWTAFSGVLSLPLSSLSTQTLGKVFVCFSTIIRVWGSSTTDHRFEAFITHKHIITTCPYMGMSKSTSSQPTTAHDITRHHATRKNYATIESIPCLHSLVQPHNILTVLMSLQQNPLRLETSCYLLVTLKYLQQHLMEGHCRSKVRPSDMCVGGYMISLTHQLLRRISLHTITAFLISDMQTTVTL